MEALAISSQGFSLFFFSGLSGQWPWGRQEPSPMPPWGRLSDPHRNKFHREAETESFHRA